MGQVSVPAPQPSLILSATDRLIASNADGGLSPASAHVILLGENAGQNLSGSNIIAMGRDTFGGGMDSSADGSTLIGENSFPFTADLATGVGNGSGAVTIVGSNAFSSVAASRRMAGLIAIGANIGADATFVGSGGLDRSILIGNSILKNNTMSNALGSDNVLIGHTVASRSNAGATQYNENTIIGSLAGSQIDTGASMTGNTVLGSRCAQNILTGNGGNVLIGRRAANTLGTGGNNVVIGGTADLAGAAEDSVVIGGTNTQAGSIDSVYLGAMQSGFSGAHNIVIGRGSGAGESAANAGRFIIEVFGVDAVRRGVLYGDMNNGCLLVGLSTPAVNRDLPGTNILKVLNGARDAGLTAPVGGGYFYSIGGELHWVSTGNVDYALTPSGGVGNFTVATLPAAPPAGTRAFATDALAPAFGVAVAGGGAVFIPVFFDGAAWIVG